MTFGNRSLCLSFSWFAFINIIITIIIIIGFPIPLSLFLFIVTVFCGTIETICSPNQNEPIAGSRPVAPLISFCADQCRRFGYALLQQWNTPSEPPFPFPFLGSVTSATCRLPSVWVELGCETELYQYLGPTSQVAWCISHILVND
ncbi:hypothetical protein BDV32DRAFT_125711 [Aspergillus pseudonomiae]|nr:hypothetical protein BDV32DRAFT_125711 [Aspergillus pseudonomiae]